MIKKTVLAFALLIAFASCATFKDYKPQRVKTDNIIRKELQDSLSVGDTTAMLHWQDFYKDSCLEALISEGLERNSELELARLRIDEAVAALRGARGLLLPSVSVAGDGNISSFDGTKSVKTYSLSSTVNWEADILRKQGNAIKGALAAVDERKAYRQLVQTRLIATIAQNYYTLEMLDAKKKVTEETIESWQKQIAILQALMTAGDTDRGIIAQAEASRYEAETMLRMIDKQIFESEGSLSTLLGRTPTPVKRGNFTIHDFSDQVVRRIPIAALATRPDVRQAEAALRSAFYQTNVARAAFYPSLRLSGSAGWTNNGSVGIVNPGSILMQAVASIAQPVFANGQNRANLAIAKSQQQQALVSFCQTVLDAGNEVNNTLNAYQTATQVTGLQELQIRKLRETIYAADAQMQYGDGNALQGIIARQSFLAAQLQKLSSEYEQIESYIVLFRVLGGGI
ncbi:efflux transporter outer membrane subunit [Xylanibacter oryzae]|uniref:efflux transporter outer membrane subunit n=1 Tax=Xylanibacter oryzae TaxID=185293 RepID=UPI0004B996D0|nr:efflux transporter outer membrane subunit [Xylanibacter oryzae]